MQALGDALSGLGTLGQMTRRERRALARAGGAVDRARCANDRVVLVAAIAGRMVATADPHDVAHAEKDLEGWLVPGPKAKGAKPRKYPAAHMTGKGSMRISWDSAFDRSWRRARAVAELGGPELVDGHERIMARAQAAALARRTGRSLRQLIEPGRREVDLPTARQVLAAYRAGTWSPDPS